jgi:hypothetical protein
MAYFPTEAFGKTETAKTALFHLYRSSAGAFQKRFIFRSKRFG